MNISHQHKNNKPKRGPDENLVPRLTCSLVIKIYHFSEKSKAKYLKIVIILYLQSKLFCFPTNLLEKTAFYGILYKRCIFNCFQKKFYKDRLSYERVVQLLPQPD